MNPIRPLMIIITVWVLLFAILSSCSSSQQEIDKAVKQTVEARVVSPQPSSTPVLALESNQIITLQPTPTPTIAVDTPTLTNDMQSLIIGVWETNLPTTSNKDGSPSSIRKEIEFAPDGYSTSVFYGDGKYPLGVQGPIQYKIIQKNNNQISQLVINDHCRSDSEDRVFGEIRMLTVDTLILQSEPGTPVETYHRQGELSVSSRKKTPIGSWISGAEAAAVILDFYENGDFVFMFFNPQNLMEHNTAYGKFEFLDNNQIRFMLDTSKSPLISEYSLLSPNSLVVKNFLDIGHLTFRRLEAKQINTDLLRKALLGKWESDEIKALGSDSKNKSTFEFVEDGTVTYNGKGVGRYTFVEPNKIELSNIVLSSLAKDETFTLRLYILSDYRLLLVSEVTSNGASIFLPPFYKK